jgi:hypothetical protein
LEFRVFLDSPFLGVEIPNTLDNAAVPSMGSVSHIEAGTVHATLPQLVQHLLRAGAGSNRADDPSPAG